MNYKRFFTTFYLFIFFFTINTHAVSAVFDANTYVYQKYVSVNRDTQKAAPYIQKLENEVNTIITSPQRFQPYYQEIGIDGGLFFWGYPGEEFLTLCQAIQYISDTTLKTNTISYVKTQMNTYRPESYSYFAAYPSGQTWGAININTGNRRERYPLPTSSVIDTNIWPSVPVPIGSLYVVSTCADATNNWSYATSNWNSLNSVYTSYASSHSTIKTLQELLGVIGYIRLANGTGNTSNVTAALNLINSSAVSLADLKTTMSNFNNRSDATLNAFVLASQPTHDWTLPFFIANRGSKALVTLYGRELGRFMKNEANTVSHQIFDIINSNARQWFMFKSHYPGYGGADASGTNTWQGQDVAWLLNSGYGENNMLTPDIVWSLFMIKAHTYNSTTAELASYLDVPYGKADLYYIQKLTAVIESTGTECWENIQTTTQECVNSVTSPTPTSQPPSPTPTPKPGDVNGDNSINLIDLSILLSNFGKTGAVRAQGDLDGNGSVNLSDLSQLLAKFGQ